MLILTLDGRLFHVGQSSHRRDWPMIDEEQARLVKIRPRLSMQDWAWYKSLPVWCLQPEVSCSAVSSWFPLAELHQLHVSQISSSSQRSSQSFLRHLWHSNECYAWYSRDICIEAGKTEVLVVSVEDKNNNFGGWSFQLIVSRETNYSAEAEVNSESWGNQLIL